MMDLGIIFETIRNVLLKLPVPLWISTAVIAGVCAWAIEKNAATRLALWAIIASIIFLLLMFGGGV